MGEILEDHGGDMDFEEDCLYENGGHREGCPCSICVGAFELADGILNTKETDSSHYYKKPL